MNEFINNLNLRQFMKDNPGLTEEECRDILKSRTALKQQLSEYYDSDVKQLQPGDDFIRISKYGHVFGIVSSIFEVNTTDTKYGIIMSSLKLKTTNGVVYDYNECYKVKKFLSQESIDRLNSFYASLAKEKRVRLETYNKNNKY